MHDRGVAGVNPAAAHGLPGSFRIVVVARHDHISAGHNFALSHAVVRHFVSLIVDNAQFARGDQFYALPRFDRRSLARGKVHVFRPRLADRNEWRGFGQSVNVRDHPAQFVFQPFDCRSRRRRAGSYYPNSTRCRPSQF